ncbi:MAG: hypothetical protein JST12_06750 [Armatimonadetes bacterium]|nr:hypothetical protein [Armatimonadota bacterium]
MPTEPTREQLIAEIADILGKVNPLPSRGKQVLSVLSSTLIRIGCLAYAIYLAFLFNTNFTNLSSHSKSEPLSTGEWILAIVFFVIFLSSFVRRVYGDRMTPLVEMIKRTGFRLGLIIFTFLFWSWMFQMFPGMGYNPFVSAIATIFILNSGYDFRLSPRSPRRKIPSPFDNGQN